MKEPVLTSLREEIVNLKGVLVWPVISHHEHEFGSEVSSQKPGQPPRGATGDFTMQFVATLHVDIRYLAFEVACQC